MTAAATPTNARARRYGIAAALAALTIDQAHKLLMLDVFDIAQRQPVRLASFFDVILVWNQGVSYSLLTMRSAAGRWILFAGTVAITIGLAIWMWRSTSALAAAGLGLIIGGAVGNALDRLFYGAVADFFYFHVGSFRWYVFNLADCAIVAGVALLLCESFFFGPTRQAQAAPSAQNLPES